MIRYSHFLDIWLNTCKGGIFCGPEHLLRVSEHCCMVNALLLYVDNLYCGVWELCFQIIWLQLSYVLTVFCSYICKVKTTVFMMALSFSFLWSWSNSHFHLSKECTNISCIFYNLWLLQFEFWLVTHWDPKLRSIYFLPSIFSRSKHKSKYQVIFLVKRGIFL